MAQGDRINYRFKAAHPVTFNMHYHDAEELILPFELKPSTENAGEFTAPLDQNYCLMWENQTVDTNLVTYQITRPR